MYVWQGHSTHKHTHTNTSFSPYLDYVRIDYKTLKFTHLGRVVCYRLSLKSYYMFNNVKVHAELSQLISVFLVTVCDDPSTKNNFCDYMKFLRI